MASAAEAWSPQQGVRADQPAHPGGLPGGGADATELWPSIRMKLCSYFEENPG